MCGNITFFKPVVKIFTFLNNITRLEANHDYQIMHEQGKVMYKIFRKKKA